MKFYETGKKTYKLNQKSRRSESDIRFNISRNICGIHLQAQPFSTLFEKSCLREIDERDSVSLRLENREDLIGGNYCSKER